MSFVTESFGKRLKFLRETVGLNQAELGEKLGISRGAVSYYENFSRTPDIEILELVKNFFDVPYDFLLGYSDNMEAEYVNASPKLHLSDKACHILEEDSFGVFNNILEHDKFIDFMTSFYLFAAKYSEYKMRDADYISFLHARLLNDIIYDVFTNDLIHNMTDEDKKREEEKAKEMEKAVADLGKARENYLKHNKEMKEIIDANPIIKEIKEVHDKVKNAILPTELKNHKNK